MGASSDLLDIAPLVLDCRVGRPISCDLKHNLRRTTGRGFQIVTGTSNNVLWRCLRLKAAGRECDGVE